MAYLGHTLGEIAREKAGILKPNVPCFLGRLPEEAHREIARRAAEVGAPLRYLGADFSPPLGPLGLGGPHQRDNAAIAIALARSVAARLGRSLDDATVAEALEAHASGPDGSSAWRRTCCSTARTTPRGPGRSPPRCPRSPPADGSSSSCLSPRTRTSAAILAALGPLAYALVATRADSPRALPAAALAARGGPILFPAGGRRRADGRARRGSPARCRWAGRRLRLDVPGRSAAGRAARRARRSAADFRSIVADAGNAESVGGGR